MVGRHGHCHHIADNWLAVNWYELLARRRHSQDRGLRRVDDRDKVRGVHHAKVRDREGATLKIGSRELVCAGLRDEFFGFAGNRAHSLDIRIADHRNH